LRNGIEPNLVFALVFALVDAIELERLRRAAAALIEGRDEALSSARDFNAVLERVPEREIVNGDILARSSGKSTRGVI